MSRAAQRGGFLAGMAVGLLLGLALALAVALYVTKVPVPFINKVPQRSAELEATQAEKNRTWDPNAPLSGRAAQRGTAGASAPAAAAPTPPTAGASPRPAPVAAPPTTAPTPAATPKPASAAASAPEAFTYFVQAGAFARGEEAEQQRASLALLGITARITEREQSGRTMYRVRLGPFERKEEADAAKERLAAAGIEAALVRVPR